MKGTRIRAPSLRTRAASAQDGGHAREKIIGAKLFVGNLNFDTSKEELEELFGELGQITDCFLPKDRETGRPRGFAFVEYADESAAREAAERALKCAIGEARVQTYLDRQGKEKCNAG